MTPPEQGQPKQRRQILDNEGGEVERLDARGNEHAGTDDDTWVRNFIARLGELVRKIGGKN
jgi:hypothetical protein